MSSDSYLKVTRLDDDPCRSCGASNQAKFECRCGLQICTYCEDFHIGRCEASIGKIASLEAEIVKLKEENKRLVEEHKCSSCKERFEEIKHEVFSTLEKIQFRGEKTDEKKDGGVEVSVVCRVCGFRPCRYRCRKPSEEVEREKDTAELECDCQNPEPETGVAGVSNHCPVHNLNPLPDS